MADQKKQSSSIVKDAIVLFLITLIAGALLGAVYQITKEPIAASELKAKEEAYQVVLADSKSFVENEELNAKLKTSVFDGAEITEVLEAMDDQNQQIGYVMSLTAKEGYGGDITFTIGVDLSGKMTGLSVLTHSETAGLGANCTTQEFQSQFVGLQGPEIAYSKTGANGENEFDAISGATITSKALTKAINAGMKFLQDNGRIGE